MQSVAEKVVVRQTVEEPRGKMRKINRYPAEFQLLSRRFSNWVTTTIGQKFPSSVTRVSNPLRTSTVAAV